MVKLDYFQASNLLVLGNGGASGGGAATMGSSALDISASCTQQQPNSVLRVIIENMLYPVTLDVLHQIFSRYGKVLRIITFNKNSRNLFQLKTFPLVVLFDFIVYRILFHLREASLGYKFAQIITIF